MYYPGKTNMVYYGHEPHGNYDMTVATFNSWNGNQGDVISGNITGDPLLNSKYQLQEGSPAIGAGMDLGAGTDLGAFSYKEGDQPGNSTH